VNANFRDPAFQKKAVLVLVPIAMAVAYHQVYFGDRMAQVAEQAARVESLESQNNAMRVIVARYGTDLERRVAVFAEHLGQLEQLIPGREDVPNLINQITEVAGSTGVELTVLRPGGETPGDHYSRQSYELEVSGDYHSVAEYLTTIGSLPRIARSANLHLLRTEATVSRTGTPLLRARFTVDTYVMPVPGESLPAPAEG
jgi:Tfp pilus assembly protein PilO